MKIIVTPNAFKNSLPANEAAEAIVSGFQKSNLKCECIAFPVGDGGDGTGSLLATHLHAKKIQMNVHGPLGDWVESQFYMTPDNKAIIELADASGLKLVSPAKLDAMTALTTGTGELIQKALDEKATSITLCVGGSATVDGAIGILQTLGVRFRDARGIETSALPSSLSSLGDIDLSLLDNRILAVDITILCDVTNPIIGDQGSAKVFGPQKGATPQQVGLLDHGLRNLCDIIQAKTGKSLHSMPMGGAAGGVAGVLHAIINARLKNGIKHFLELTDFNKALDGAHLVVTGEGRIDDQTFQGKGPMGVAEAASRKNIRTIALAGDVAITDEAAAKRYFGQIISIKKPGQGVNQAMASTWQNLEHAAFEIGNSLAGSPPGTGLVS